MKTCKNCGQDIAIHRTWHGWYHPATNMMSCPEQTNPQYAMVWATPKDDE